MGWVKEGGGGCAGVSGEEEGGGREEVGGAGGGTGGTELLYATKGMISQLVRIDTLDYRRA